MTEVDFSTITPELHEVLLATFTHPARNGVFSAVAERPGVTAREIATRLGISQRSVRHHLDWLLDAGLIVASAESTRRNTRVYHYRAVIAPFRTGEEGGAPFSQEEERQFALAVLRLLIADARAAVANRTFGTHPSHVELRVPSQLDDRGLEETSAILIRALDEVMVVRRESVERLRASGEEGTETISALLLFEAQPWKTDG